MLDESMVPFRGRLSFCQYIPSKAHSYGIKLFKLCDSQGYTYAVEIYAGKRDVKIGLAADVVLRLCEPYLNQGRTVCTDNFYTSLPLAEKLLQSSTHLVGTLRCNRKGIPPDIVKSKLKKDKYLQNKTRME